MMKRLILILALVLVAGVFTAAYAEVQNVKVGGDILMQGVMRKSFNLEKDSNGAGTGTPRTPNEAILSAIRVRVDADLTDNVSATVRLLNERAWGHESGTNSGTGIDLDLGYVTLKEFLYSPLSLVIGRQELRYGNALIIGDVDTNEIASGRSQLPTTMTDLSVRKSFDAAKAILNYDPLVLDIVAAKIEENATNVENDVDLYGANAAYTVNQNLLTEAYMWQRVRKYGSTGYTTSLPGNPERLNTAGLRASYTGIANLMVGIEGAYQFGDHVTSATLYPNDGRVVGQKSEVSAFALQAVASYNLPHRFSPVVGGSYTYLSGDKDHSTSKKYHGWDPMYENQAQGTIFNKILGYSNARLLNLNASVRPLEDVSVKLDWYDIRLNHAFRPTGTNATEAVFMSGIASDPTSLVKGGKNHLADEFDVTLTYDYTEDVQLGLMGGVYMPGNVYDKQNKRDATQLIGSMKVTF